MIGEGGGRQVIGEGGGGECGAGDRGGSEDSNQ